MTGDENDYLLMDRVDEPDLTILSKRYLSLGYDPLDTLIERGYDPTEEFDPFTNNYEFWRTRARGHRVVSSGEREHGMGSLGPATTLVDTQHGEHFIGQMKRGLISLQDIIPGVGLGADTSGRYTTGGPVDSGGTPYIPGGGASGGSSGGSTGSDTKWPSWSYKWVPYALPSVPSLTGTSGALTKLKSPPVFFAATLKYIQGGVRTPSWNPPVAKFAFPDPTTVAIPDSVMATLDVGSMVSYMNQLLALISTDNLKKVITHYTEFNNNITYIDQNLPDWGKYALDTNVERLVRIGRKIPDTLRDALRWMDSSHTLLVSTVRSVQAFESSVITLFQTVAGKINAVFASVIANTRNAVGAVLAQVKTLGAKYTDQVKAYFNDLAGYIKDYVGTFVGIVKEWVGGLVGTMVTDAGVMRQWLTDVTKALADGIMLDMTTVSDWVRGVFSGFSTNLSSNVTTLGTSMDSYTRGLVSAFTSEVTNVKNMVTDELKRVGTALRDAFGADLAAARKEFQEMVSKLSTDIKAGYAELREQLNAAKVELVQMTENITKMVDILDALKTRSEETEKRLSTLDDRATVKFAELEAAIKDLQKGQVPKSQGSFFNRLFGFAT